MEAQKIVKHYVVVFIVTSKFMTVSTDSVQVKDLPDWIKECNAKYPSALSIHYHSKYQVFEDGTHD